jgi:Zn-dependent oligopeptidase
MISALLVFTGCYYKKSPEMRLCSRLDWQSVLDVFPKNIDQIKALKNKSIAVMNEMLESLQDRSAQKSTFHNTVRLYDNAQFKFTMNLQILSTLAMLSGDARLRLAAQDAITQLNHYKADKLVRNSNLLHAFENYAQHGNDDQSKTAATRSFLQKSIQRLEHEGASLSPKVIAKLNKLAKEIDHLEGQFSSNCMNHHHKTIDCHHDELAGVPEELLHQFEKHANRYLIPLTYDAFFTILENCTNAATSKNILCF